jgi:histidinol-phosphate aminotransferase
VSPNNPTGSVVGAAELTRLAQALPGVLVLLDLAYVEFADEDLTPTALELPNVVVFRTLSKAWAAAGLRVGYAMGDARVISWLRAAGQPYPVSAPSLIAARRLLSRAQGVGSHVEGVLRQRDRVLRGLRELGLEAMDSQANFVLVYFQDAQWTLDALAGLGIGVRSFPGRPGLEGWLRITIPSEESLADRLLASLRTVLRPQALFFDLDGVLADVSRSYRLAILQTASAFGVELAPDEIAQAKAAGNSNNDWLLTQALLRRHGVEQPLSEIRELFEGLYQGADGQRGLWRDEPLLISRGLLDELAAQYPLAIVTGRPRSDAVRFLEMHRVQEFFDAVVTLEDGPSKPDPTPVLRALDALAVERAWMLGDTPDDVAAARAAGVLPVGVMAPGDDVGLAREGLRDASRVLRSVNEIQEILP